MSPAKTTNERVEKLRQEREALGLRRRELYAHDDDWPKLQELAAKLQRKRERDAKRTRPICLRNADYTKAAPSNDCLMRLLGTWHR